MSICCVALKQDYGTTHLRGGTVLLPPKSFRALNSLDTSRDDEVVHFLLVSIAHHGLDSLPLRLIGRSETNGALFCPARIRGVRMDRKALKDQRLRHRAICNWKAKGVSEAKPTYSMMSNHVKRPVHTRLDQESTETDTGKLAFSTRTPKRFESFCIYRTNRRDSISGS